MATLAELLAEEVDLDSLSQEDLDARKIALTDAVKAAREEPLNDELLELMKRGATAVADTKAAIAANEAEAARIIREADEALASIAEEDPEEVETDPEAEVETDPEAEVEVETPAVETETPAAVEAEAVPIAAAATPARPNRNVTVPARSRPRTTHRNGPIMTAQGEISGIPQGSQFATTDDMFRAVHAKWVSMRGAADGVPHTVASINWGNEYGPERCIDGGDAYAVTNQLMGYIEDRSEKLRQRASERAAMVASGGVPGPGEPIYTVPVYGQADRPLVAGLPSVKMTRGTTVFNTAPVLAAVVLDTGAGAVGTVTSGADATGATKDIQEVPAPVQGNATVEAETLRWSQGQFADRFLPEWTAAFMKLGLTAFARHNDALRLADIKTASTKYTVTPAKFGAYRDLKREVMGELENLSDLIRDYAQPIRLLLPEFVPAMLAVDLIAQAPGDEAWRITKESVRADINGWDPRINVTFLKDSIRGALSTVPTGQSPRTPGFDSDVEWAMFPEGAFVYGDGGSLDLGILRDSGTVATNKFQTFFEQWECLFRLVDKSLCFWNTSSLCANGLSQAAASVTGVCEPGES